MQHGPALNRSDQEDKEGLWQDHGFSAMVKPGARRPSHLNSEEGWSRTWITITMLGWIERLQNAIRVTSEPVGNHRETVHGADQCYQ